MSLPREIDSTLLQASRQVWIEAAPSAGPGDCVVLLDAELYRGRVQALDRMAEARASGMLQHLTCVQVSAPDPAARHRDFTCNETYADFVATELREWIGQAIGPQRRWFVAGLSLSGLAAAFAVLRYPNGFAGALCQSPSAWWNDEWLTAQLDHAGPPIRQCRFWISVGDKEIQENLVHPPTGLLQKVSQLDSCRRLAAKLAAGGAPVHFSVFSGGHDPQCWGDEWLDALQWLLEVG